MGDTDVSLPARSWFRLLVREYGYAEWRAGQEAGSTLANRDDREQEYREDAEELFKKIALYVHCIDVSISPAARSHAEMVVEGTASVDGFVAVHGLSEGEVLTEGWVPSHLADTLEEHPQAIVGITGQPDDAGEWIPVTVTRRALPE